MAFNLLTDITLVTDDTFGGAFADISGMSDTVSIAGPSSVVILMTSNVPDNKIDNGDACVEYRFTVDGSPVGGPLSAFHDTNTEFAGREVMFAVDGLTAGNHTFAVQARNRSGTGGTETTIDRTFQVLEITSGAAIIVDLSTSVANVAPATWANVTNLSGSATPVSTSSILLMIAGATIDAVDDHDCAEFRFAIDGARDGPYANSQEDNVDEMDSMSMAWAETGLSVASHTFSLQWQELSGVTPAMDTGRARYLQVIEIDTLAALVIDEISVAADTAPGSYADMVDMDGTAVIGDAANIVLMLANYIQDGFDSNDERADSQLAVDGIGVGAEQMQFKDDTDRLSSTMMARAVTGESGSTDFSMQWQIGKESPIADTSKERTFQAIELTSVTVHTASGAPAITKPTSAGAAVRKVTASGAPSITKPISAGSAIRKIVASGAPEIAKPTSAGTARRIIKASGAPSIPKPVSSGNAIYIEAGIDAERHYSREDQHRNRLEIEDDDNLAIVTAFTKAIIEDED